ncbi:short-chain dehydrogenase [Agaricicola taiwanensis]|uniref:Short-chain dehydrogenase n=1 Tax=Agaricicola taiwanensis TaxID=591372 RepID=A0A8J2YD58_9RHOB|nr:SDR family oxidoreductase [Agaricicola taiwanensis]GGE32844.1 short-chain dehydrogenase [Agaricicola taiwanensis]
MDIRLDGRSAIITGGSKGLGFAAAQSLATSGANVAIFARRADVLEEACHSLAATARGKVEGFVCDVAKKEDIEASFGKVIAAFGAVDILLNNAGQGRANHFETVTDELWQADFDQKLFAAIRLARLAWPGMKERRWGRIINVLNIGAKAPRAASMPTSVTRAAGMALTKAMAWDGGPHNILVNALLIGKIVTDQIARRHPDDQAGLEKEKHSLGSSVPLGRMGEAAEFANIACFLASDAASYINGTAINVDGGLSPVA